MINIAAARNSNAPEIDPAVSLVFNDAARTDPAYIPAKIEMSGKIKIINAILIMLSCTMVNFIFHLLPR